MDAEELEALQVEPRPDQVDARFGFVSYLDLVWRERAVFVSLPQQEQRLQRLARLVEPLDAAYATVEGVVRPALVDLTGPQEGFAVSLYVKALGTDAAQAYERWARGAGGGGDVAARQGLTIGGAYHLQAGE